MNSTKRPIGSVLFMLLVTIIFQSQASASGSNLLFYSLAAIALLIFFFIVVSVADNFMVIQSNQTISNNNKANMGLYPRINELFAPSKPDFLEDEPLVTLRQGYDIPLEGAPDGNATNATGITRYAIGPVDFVGLQPIPRVVVEVGDTVKAGDVIFFDKKLDRIKFCAPVSGEIIEINRGLKRSIANIVILADKEQVSRSYEVPSAGAGREELVEFLLESGAWPGIRQRPYNIVADPDLIPRDIFISTFDTAPLAGDLTLAITGRRPEFQAGLDVLRRLTDGLVYLGLDGRRDSPSPYAGFTGVEQRYFRGAHPAGNVGVQIHHTHPAGNGDNTVWTLDVNAVLLLGELFKNGQYNTQRIVALSGAPLPTPTHVRTFAGANVGELLKGQGFHTAANSQEPKVDEGPGEFRVISGDVLTGDAVGESGYLGFFDDQVTVLEEGDEPEIFGWLLPLKPRASVSPTIPTLGKLEATTNTHGEKRAFVVNNDYEQVMPMDIYTQQLMKSIMINDFEGMEGLGIYELVEEDVALAEFACVSKQPLQRILREGLDTMRLQG